MYNKIRQIAYISIFLWIGFLSNIYTNISAYTSKSRNLPWINIIKRADWITDQSIIFKKQSSIPVNTDTDEDNPIKTASKIDIINKHLVTVFPEQVLLDGIIKQIDGKDLLRSRGYQINKSHVVVHHTVNDLDKIKTPEEARAVANSIFRYHTQSNGRWDIGYNFIIDRDINLRPFKLIHLQLVPSF